MDDNNEELLKNKNVVLDVGEPAVEELSAMKSLRPGDILNASDHV